MTSLVLIAASALVALLAWSGPEWVGLGCVLVALWAAARTRLAAFGVAAVYYLIGARSIPASAGAFFESEWSYLFGMLIWVAQAAILGGVWAACWTRLWRWHDCIWRPMLAVFIAIAPPIGIIGWLNPWMSSAAIFPGMGWGAIIAGLIMLPAITFLSLLYRLSPVFIACLAIIHGVAISGPLQNPPSDWLAINTTMEAAPKFGSRQELRRITDVAAQADMGLQSGARVVVLPELIAGQWGDRHKAYMPEYLKRHLAEGKIAIIGAATEKHGTLLNSMAVLADGGVITHSSRQSVPFSMWHPWDKEAHFPSDWLGNGALKIAGRTVATSICYEDFLFGLHLLTFAKNSPDLMLSIGNGWWAANSNVLQVQHLHIKTVARIFGIPLLRAINLPKES